MQTPSTTRYGETTRLYIILSILLIAALGLVVRLVWLQVKTSNDLIERGFQRSLRMQTEDALRGMIVDREGEALAISTPVSTVIADPQKIWESFGKDYEDLKKRCPLDPDFNKECPLIKQGLTEHEYQMYRLTPLAEVLEESTDELFQMLDKRRNSHFFYLVRQAPPNVAEEAMALGIQGIWKRDSYKRYYPAGEIVSYIVGYTNIEDQGQEGLEKLYETQLAGQTGKVKVLQDPKGQALRVVEEVTPASPGAQLQLSIDKRIQFITHQVLTETMHEFQAKSATAVMVDVQTGEILAMVTVPSGNPNNTSERQAQFIKNRAVTDTFEPGSTMKPLAVASALEAGVITPNTVFAKGGIYRMGRNVVRDTHNYGTQDVIGIIRKSSNVGMAMISERLPRAKHYQFMRSLGFGQKTDIGFPAEQQGILRNPEKVSAFDFATTTYGYGVSTTALQMAHAYATLANDGVAMPLSLIKRNYIPEGKRVISEKTAHAVQKMLTEVVSETGTGKRANMESYTVAGKTGTSHKVLSSGGYAEKNYLGLFAGYAPATNPKIAMIVVVDDPQGAHYGGLVAAPAFAKITEWSLKILGVLPDKIDKSKPENIKLEADPKIIDNSETKNNENGNSANDT